MRPTPKFVRPWPATWPAPARALALPLLPSGGVVEIEARRVVGRTIVWVVLGPAWRRGGGGQMVCMLLSRLRSKSSRVLQAQLDAELVGVVQVDLGDQHLDHRPSGGRASSCSMIPLISSKNRGVALRIRLLLTGSGTTTTSALELLERAGQPRGVCWTCRSCGEVVEACGHVVAGRVLQPENDGLAVADVAVVQPGQNGLDHGQIAHRAGGDDAVGPRVHGEPQGHDRAVRSPDGACLDRPGRQAAARRRWSPGAANSVWSMSARLVASPLTMVNTLIWASAAGSRSI